ncbi:MAG: hypothetical protein LBL51_04325 [Synergistaceae bacterium]|jgi:nickel transport protein|nr:hypothetical protein [Synergistaceae bacterium]
MPPKKRLHGALTKKLSDARGSFLAGSPPVPPASPGGRGPLGTPIKKVGAALFAAIGALALGAPGAFAHGAGYRLSDKRPVSLEFYYSTGETMSYEEAKVFSPKDEKFAFQSGRTDEAGRFAFTPDTPGPWRVVVRDGEGHLAEAQIEIVENAENAGNDSLAPKEAGLPEGTGLFVKAGLGVSLLFNAAAFVSLARRKRPSGEVK